jgi:uncharacterized protein (TIGR00369 family)
VNADAIAWLRRGFGRDGRPVPAHETLGVNMQDVGVGTAVSRLTNGPLLTDESGAMLPGALGIIADTCCGSAVASALSGDGTNVTAQMRVEFVRPVPTGTRWVEGRGEADVVDDEGGLARGELLDDQDELLAVSSMRALRTLDGPSRPGREHPAVPAPAVRPVGPDDVALPRLAVHDLLGVTTRVAGSGRATWTLAPDLRTANSFHATHGGVVALLAHLVATDAQRSVLGEDEWLVPLDLVVNYYRAVAADGSPSVASAEVMHRGRRFVVAEGVIAPAGGRVAVRFSVGGQVRHRS